MKRIVAGLASLLAVAAHQEARAATFAPDMWIYEVNLVPDYVDAPISAEADVPPGTPVPAGCTGGDFEAVRDGVPYTTINCADNPGIDLMAAIGGAEAFTVTGRIGFNASTILCDTNLLIGCPKNEQDSGGFGWSSVAFTKVALDAASGELSYCGMLGYADVTACYGLAPGEVTVSSARRNVGSLSGTWDIGYEGRWWSHYPDNFLYYTGTGRLVSAPEVVPLPAAALMLGSALLGFGAVGRSRRGPRRANGG
jgi:hypothetical protein